MHMFWMKYPLREEKAEGGEGGGAAGGAEGGAGGAGGGTAITMEAITALMNTSINNAVNGAVAKIEKRLEKVEKPVVATPTTPVKPAEGTPPTESEKLAKQEVTELTTRLATLEEERKAEKQESQKRELAAEVKTALSDFTWDPTQGGKDIAFDYFKGKATRAEDGSIMIGDVSLQKYVKEQVPRQFKGMLAARQVGGAGAEKGAGGGSGKPSDLNEIGIGMSKETEARVLRDISAALAQAQAES